MRWLSTCAVRLAIPLAASGALLSAGCKNDPANVPPPPTLGTQTPKNAATSATLLRPIAAALSPDAKTLYVTAFDQMGQGQVMSGAVGGALSPLTTGVTLSYPCGIAVSPDGMTLLVTDLGDAGSAGPTGAIYRGTATGALTAVSAAMVTHPTAVAVSLDSATAYVTGSDQTDGQPGVWSIALSGGAVTQLVKGSPLNAPAGITVANDSSVYVADTGASGGGLGAIFRIQSGRSIQINKTPLRMHFPAGITSAGTGYPDILYTVAQTIGTEEYLYRLSPDGTASKITLAGDAKVIEATTVARAAKADTWALVNGVAPAADVAPNTPDPAKLENPDGHVIQLTP